MASSRCLAVLGDRRRRGHPGSDLRTGDRSRGTRRRSFHRGRLPESSAPLPWCADVDSCPASSLASSHVPSRNRHSSNCAAALWSDPERTTFALKNNRPAAIDWIGMGVERMTSISCPTRRSAGANITPDSLMFRTRPDSHSSSPGVRYDIGTDIRSRCARRVSIRIRSNTATIGGPAQLRSFEV